MIHTCKNLKKAKLFSDVDIIVKKDKGENVGKLLLFKDYDKKHLAMGTVIWYCPLCGEKLKSDKSAVKMYVLQKEPDE